MALTNYQRIDAARANSIFTDQVAASLVKHSKYLVRNEAATEADKTLARNILNNPDAYTWRFGASLLTEPVYDNLADITALTDQQVQDTVAELWPLFVAPAA